MKIIKILVLIFLISSGKLISQNTIPKEQVAFEYFFQNIFVNSYKDVCKLEFSGSTEDEISSFGTIYNFCLGEDVAKELYKASLENKNKNKVWINTDKLKNTKLALNKRKQKFRVIVLKTSKINNLYYVQIEIMKKRHYVDSYFFVIDENNDVLNWCKSNVII